MTTTTSLTCPRIRVPSFNTAPSTNLSSVSTAGITLDPDGMPATLENKKIAAGSEPKKVRAPAKKKLPLWSETKKRVEKLD